MPHGHLPLGQQQELLLQLARQEPQGAHGVDVSVGAATVQVVDQVGAAGGPETWGVEGEPAGVAAESVEVTELRGALEDRVRSDAPPPATSGGDGAPSEVRGIGPYPVPRPLVRRPAIWRCRRWPDAVPGFEDLPSFPVPNIVVVVVGQRLGK